MRVSDTAAFKAALAAFIDPDRLIDDPLRRLAYGTDASFYRLVPQLVVKVVSEQEVARLLQLAHEHRTLGPACPDRRSPIPCW
jgi:D-lactate dehydrogenase